MKIRCLFDIPRHQLANYPQDKAIGRKEGSSWKFWSIGEILDQADKVSHGLLELGVNAGDKIALISFNNRPEWNIMDLAILQIGAINVPVYPTISPREYEYIFNDAGIKYCFVSLDHPEGKPSLLEKVKAAKPNIPSLMEIYTFDKSSDAPYWEDLFKDGESKTLENKRKNINPEELATIIYTSGTTGNPKGVMLSHRNIVSNVEAVLDLVPIGEGDTALSFLPLCHIFERTVSYTYLAKGINIYYTGTNNLGGESGDLKNVKPHFFTTVPRLLEKVYEKIYNKGLELTGAKKKLFFWALSLTEDFELDQKPGFPKNIQLAIADKLIFSKWRDALGGNIKGILSGAAACSKEIAQVFSAAGIPIREGYGLTETSPALSIGRYTPGGGLLGTVGPPLSNVEIIIDPSDGDYRKGEGEILAKGPNIMLGYYNKPEATAEVIDKDGWFHTGDIGTFVTGPSGEKFLKITGRKKALLKTSGGKYVAPEPIEKALSGEFLIEQVMVVGEGKKFVSALIVPSPLALKEWCEKNKVNIELTSNGSDFSMATISSGTLTDPAVISLFGEIVSKHNPNFSHIEQIKKFKLLGNCWTIETGELTPTMKVKRQVILEKYKSEISDIYSK